MQTMNTGDAQALVLARPYVLAQTQSSVYAVKCRALQVLSHINSALRRVPLTDNDQKPTALGA